MYTFTMVGCTLFKLCHCKCTKAYLLVILGMSQLWHNLVVHGRPGVSNSLMLFIVIILSKSQLTIIYIAPLGMMGLNPGTADNAL